MCNKALLESIQLLEKLSKVSKGRKAEESISKYELEAAKPSLLLLLKYLIKNLDSANVDQVLLITLMRVLSLKLSDIKCEEEEELEKEEEISEERKKQLLRLLIYEMYKITNPNRLAGETALENFINNVQTRGIEVAQLWEGAEDAALFSSQELQNAESHRHSFVESLRGAGMRGGGRGL